MQEARGIASYYSALNCSFELEASPLSDNYFLDVFGCFIIPRIAKIKIHLVNQNGAWLIFEAPGTQPLVLSSFAAAADELIRTLNLRAVESVPEMLRLHAGAVVVESGSSALLVGASGAGKTNITFECLRQGGAYLTDETVAYHFGDHTVFGNRKPLTIKTSSHDRLSHLDPRHRGHDPELTRGGSWHVPPSWFGGTLADGPATPTVLAFPERVEGATGTTVTTLRPAEAALLVGQQTSYLSSTPNALAALKRLTEDTHCVRVTAASSAHIADAVMDLLR